MTLDAKRGRVSPRRVLTPDGPGTLRAEDGLCYFVELDTPTHASHCGFLDHEPILPIDDLQDDPRKGLWFANDEIQELPLMEYNMIDLFESDEVEVTINHSGTKLWVNVNGECLLRAYRVKKITIVDNREKQ